MKHTDLKKGDTIIEISFRCLTLVKVFKVTNKTIQTKMSLSSSIKSIHGKHFGDYLYVLDDSRLSEIRKIEELITELERRKSEFIKQFEKITIEGSN